MGNEWRDLNTNLGRLHGVDVTIHPFLQDTPKLKFDWPEPTAAMEQFNAWLAERFGSVPPYIVIGNTLFTNQRGYNKLVEETK